MELIPNRAINMTTFQNSRLPYRCQGIIGGCRVERISPENDSIVTGTKSRNQLYTSAGCLSDFFFCLIFPHFVLKVGELIGNPFALNVRLDSPRTTLLIHVR